VFIFQAACMQDVRVAVRADLVAAIEEVEGEDGRCTIRVTGVKLPYLARLTFADAVATVARLNACPVVQPA